MSDPNYLDVDAITPKVQRILKLKGRDHAMVDMTVEAWLANLEDVRKTQTLLEDPKTLPDQAAKFQMEVTIASIQRSYPTLADEDLGLLSLQQLDAIIKFTRAIDGSDAFDAEIKKALSENPQTPSPIPSTTA